MNPFSKWVWEAMVGKEPEKTRPHDANLIDEEIQKLAAGSEREEVMDAARRRFHEMMDLELVLWKEAIEYKD